MQAVRRIDVVVIARTLRATIIAALIVTILIDLTATVASASELIGRNTSNVRFLVNKRGVALVEYKARGRSHHVVYWKGLNWTLRFKHDRSGGLRSHVADYRDMVDACGPYKGPQLEYVVDQCTMPNGTHWVLQEWERIIPNYGGVSGPAELRISHFRGPIATLHIWTDWSWHGKYEHLYGQYLYQGRAVFGYKVTPTGQSLDMMGRNVAIDSWDSDYGAGWRRVNSFLSNSPNGQFCFGFAPKGGSPFTGRSKSEWYYASVPGPGVSPDVFLMFRGQLGAYDPQADAIANYWQEQLAAGTTGGSCTVRN